MDENEVLGVDEEAGTGTEGTEVTEDATQIVIDTSAFASEIAVLETKMDLLTEKVTGCYCLLLILAVLSFRNVLRSIIRKVRGGIGGMEDV